MAVTAGRVSKSASTRPGMVCSVASAATVKPRSRAVALVIGPMLITRGANPAGARPPGSCSASRETVLEDVHVMWEGTDQKTMEGNGVFRRKEVGDMDEAWISIVVGRKQ